MRIRCLLANRVIQPASSKFTDKFIPVLAPSSLHPINFMHLKHWTDLTSGVYGLRLTELQAATSLISFHFIWRLLISN